MVQAVVAGRFALGVLEHAVESAAVGESGLRGDGVDSAHIAFILVEQALGLVDAETVDISLDEYRLEAITGGTDALAETFVVVSDEEGHRATGRATREDVIISSVVAVINSINKLLNIKENS